MIRDRLPGWVFSILVCIGTSFLQAQCLTQSVSLRPGWNAVYLRVQPEPNDCAAVFANVPIQSVWAWNRRFRRVRHVQDATTLTASQEDWLHYVPATRSGSVVTTLHAVHGGRAYLIELGGSEPVEWSVQGTPVVPRTEWVPDSFNLVGLPVAPDELASLASFFGPSASHGDPRIHRLTTAGRWVPASSSVTSSLGDAEAVWVHCGAPSEYQAPISLELEQNDGLHFGRDLTETTIRIRNHARTARTVHLALRAPESPGNPDAPFLAGAVPLSCYRVDAARIGWMAVDGLLEIALDPGAQRAVRLAVRRADMAPFTPPAGGTSRSGVVYSSLLEISDGEGTRYTIPVTSEGLVAYRKRDGVLKAVDPRVGLWVGHVTIDYVSCPAQVTPDPDPVPGTNHTPNIPEGGEFEFRLIVHVDEGLQARLVQQVTLMFEPGEYGPDPVNAARRVVTEPGRHVLITDDALLSRYTGAALRGGEPVGRRISTAAYAFAWTDREAPRPSTADMTAAFPGDGVSFPDELSCVLTMPADDPLNPFKHKYHPDHDNLDERFEAAVEEAFTVSRAMVLDVTDTDPERPDDPPQWLDSEIGGYYSETVTGVHKDAITVKGTFRLERVSSIGSLNDG